MGQGQGRGGVRWDGDEKATGKRLRDPALAQRQTCGGRKRTAKTDAAPSFLQDNAVVVIGSGKAQRCFAFDHAFGPESEQEEVYGTCVRPLIADCVKGYNCTVFAYGQTGSGKTFTIGCKEQEERAEGARAAEGGLERNRGEIERT